MKQSCPACGGGTLDPFFSIPSVPVFCNVLAETREAAIAAPQAPIELACCGQCELLYNVAFDPAKVAYATGYENTLDFSPHFRAYQDELVAGLIERHRLRGKRIVEIGCGQGDFLGQLCAAGGSEGFGFDPSYDPETAVPPPPGVTIVPDLFHSRHLEAPADLVCCRHVLEHIGTPLDFLRELRASLGDRSDTIVFFEVPNGLWTVEALGIWDLIYEHCSYFVPAALERLFARAGFAVQRVTPAYDGQFLTIESVPAAGETEPPPPHAPIAPLIDRFARSYEAVTSTWRARLAEHAAAGERVVLWGAGSKGVTFVNVMRPELSDVPCIVDLNPRKHGRFVPGTGQEVISPAKLESIDPARVIVMNPSYVEEIAGMLGELGLDVPVAPLAPERTAADEIDGLDSGTAGERIPPRGVL